MDNVGNAQPRRQFYGSRQEDDSQSALSRGDDRDPDDDDGRVLMVDQLWCWVLDKGKEPLIFNPDALANGDTLQKQLSQPIQLGKTRVQNNPTRASHQTCRL
jgi:hypothetical protein